MLKLELSSNVYENEQRNKSIWCHKNGGSEYYKNCLLGIFETALTFCTFRREKTPKTSLLVLRRMVGSYVRTLFTNSYGMQGRHALFQNGNIKMKVWNSCYESQHTSLQMKDTPDCMRNSCSHCKEQQP